MNDKTRKDEAALTMAVSILESIRQWWFPPEFRIAPPSSLPDIVAPAEDELEFPPGVEAAERSAVSVDSRASNQFVAEVATCLWYLKTKHFKRDWEDDGTDDNGSDDDPRVRRALGRLNRGINALSENGIEIDDPTNKRYPQGGEGMMRPLQFQPTAGLTFEKVTETVIPVVYRDDQLIQRGEVFVAVPKEDPTAGAPPEGGAEGVETPGEGCNRAADPTETNQDNAGKEAETPDESTAAPRDATETEQGQDAVRHEPAAEQNNQTTQ